MWSPSSYVVVRIGDNVVTNIDDEITEDLVGGDHPRPLQFTNAGEDDILYEVSREWRRGGVSWHQAHAARILLSLFDEEDLDCPDRCVSTVVAAEGRQVLALYLLAFERMGVSETADFLDISRQTVLRWIPRRSRSLTGRSASRSRQTRPKGRASTISPLRTGL